MKKISYWASVNIKSARILIVFLKILLAALAYYTAMALYKLQVILPAEIIYSIALLILIIIVAVYPSKKKEILSKKIIYIKRKTWDLILPLCSFVVIATMINNWDSVTVYAEVHGSGIVKKLTVQQILASDKTKESLSRQEKRVLKKEFFKQLKVYATAKVRGDKKEGDDAWKIILAIVAALGVAYLLAAIVCSLSCNGSDAAAIILALLGTAGLIWALVVIIKRIKHGPKKPKSS